MERLADHENSRNLRELTATKKSSHTERLFFK